jgi:acetoin utilization protein AcuB
MKVKDLMSKKVFTVGPDDVVDRVFFLLHYEKIRHLPVVEKQRVVGIVSDRDLYKALGPRSRRGTVVREQGDTMLYVIPRKVRHIMRRGVITIEPESLVGKAASMMARKRIGALPVVSRNKLVGIITATDLLSAFAKLSAKVADL